MFQRKNVLLTRPERSQIKSERVKAHSGIRPSLVNSTPCISSGSRTLDKALAHGGIPIGSITLLEEHGTTDFVSALLRSMSTLSVIESRENLHSHTICVGIPEWLRALPSLAKPGRSSKSTADTKSNPKMKIAWRYAKYSGSGESEQPSPYCRDVDFKATLVPAPQHNEVSYVLGRSLDELIRKLEAEVSRLPQHTLLRIVLPSFLHPAVYSNLALNCSPQSLYPFMAQLKKIVKTHPNAVAFISLPLQLYPRTRSVVAGLELLCDTCVELEPFDSGDEKVQGFLHINRISGITDRGEMAEQRNELSFRLTRHQFEVSPYSIPVEVEDEVHKNSEQESW